MLLFILIVDNEHKHGINFKTSHVIVYPTSESLKERRCKFQNISCYCLSQRSQNSLCCSGISKHLMLLFICIVDVTFLHLPLISKHLMLLFISAEAAGATALTIFQNISCYCLSFARIYQKRLWQNFKTSHVIVYQKYNEYSVMGANKFQNISCYCLSFQCLY